MFEPFDPTDFFDPYRMADNIGQFFGKVVEWLGMWLSRFADWFDPAKRIIEATTSVVQLMPMKLESTSFVMEQASAGLGWVLNAMAFLDWVIDLRFFCFVIGLVMGTEAMLVLIRLERMIRSFIF